MDDMNLGKPGKFGGKSVGYAVVLIVLAVILGNAIYFHIREYMNTSRIKKGMLPQSPGTIPATPIVAVAAPAPTTA